MFELLIFLSACTEHGHGFQCFLAIGDAISFLIRSRFHLIVPIFEYPLTLYKVLLVGKPDIPILHTPIQNITLEQGKTLVDAEGDVIRGLQIVEHACSVTSLQMGETMPSVTKDMDTYSIRYTSGLCTLFILYRLPSGCN